MKNLNLFLLAFVTVLSTALSLSFPTKVQAKTAAPSAVLTTQLSNKVEDKRADHLKMYLESRNSPLAPYAQTFINEADKNNLDWKLVAAISGLESSFGLHIPYASYNGWGYGVYGTNVRRFESWEDGIAVVSKALREDYMTKWKAKTIPEIGRIYAASPTWAVRVESFMNDIETFEPSAKSTLALSL